MIKQCIILAGGLGTRLKSAVPNLPKCMAPINGLPFIGYVIDYFLQQGVTHFIFALGYKSDHFNAFLASKLAANQYQISIENEPLGTGGAIKLACEKVFEKDVFVTNGDTLFTINLNNLAALHQSTHADCTLSLKPMQNFDRYGVVECNLEHRIESFKEKQFYNFGYINGGLFALNVEQFKNQNFPEKFSFEKDYLETFVAQKKMMGNVQDVYFIDIGIPEDYAKAQHDLLLQ